MQMVKQAETLNFPVEDSAVFFHCSDFESVQLTKVLKVSLFEEGIQSHFESAEYGTVYQTLLEPNSKAFAESVKYVLVSMSTQVFRDQYFKSSNSADENWKLLKSAVQKITDSGRVVILNTLPDPIEREFGNLSSQVESSLIFQIKKWNQQLCSLASGTPGVFILDTAHIAHSYGLENWFDDGLWLQAKYSCHQKYYPLIGKSLARLVSTLSGNVKKCVVIDLDNTMWGGVVGDDGADGVEIGGTGIGEAFKNFQLYMKSLKEAGYLLALASKNFEAKAKEVFEIRPEMELKWDDFVSYRINWDDKAKNIQEIAGELNIGLNSIVFLDDNPFERNLVRSMLPEVSVPELPEDPSEYVRFLNQEMVFESVQFSTEDKTRTELYNQENQRKKVQTEYQSVEDYLANLEMKAKVQNLVGPNLSRSSQLLQRSNQFNLRTQRTSEAEILKISDLTGEYKCFCVHLQDRFGALGNISVVILQISDDECFIKELVMSCRVLKRGMEEFIFNNIFEIARKKGLKQVKGEYIPTEKNGLVKDLFENFGFKRVSSEDTAELWILPTDEYEVRSVQIEREEMIGV